VKNSIWSVKSQGKVSEFYLSVVLATLPMEGFLWMCRARVAHVSAQGQGHS